LAQTIHPPPPNESVNKMNCELMLTYDTPALRQTGSRNLMGPKTLPTIWSTYMKLVTKYQISAINSCWERLTKIYPLLSTSVQPISITKTLLIVPTKNERDPPLFTSKLLIKFQNILRNATQDIIRHRVKILFSVISSPITLEQQKWKSSKKKGILLSSPVNSW
jgi:two-component sensor histidine kinase